MTYIGDANDQATILEDAGIFFQSYFAATDADETASLDLEFGLEKFPPGLDSQPADVGTDPGP